MSSHRKPITNKYPSTAQKNNNPHTDSDRSSPSNYSNINRRGSTGSTRIPISGKRSNSSSPRNNNNINSQSKSNQQQMNNNNTSNNSDEISSIESEIVGLRANINNYQNHLNNAIKNGTSNVASHYGGLLASETAKLNELQSKLTDIKHHKETENRIINTVIDKLNKIKSTVNQKKNELIQIQFRCYRYFKQPKIEHYPFTIINYNANNNNNGNNSNGNTFSASAIINSLSNTFSSTSNTNSNNTIAIPDTETDLLPKLRKSIKECQVICGQQTELVDSITDNIDKSLLKSHILDLLKSMRKDCVLYIQQQEKYADEFEKQLTHFEIFMQFLASNPTQANNNINSNANNSNNNNNNSNNNHVRDNSPHRKDMDMRQ